MTPQRHLSALQLQQQHLSVWTTPFGLAPPTALEWTRAPAHGTTREQAARSSAKRPRRETKHPYYVRKEEKQALQQQVQELQARLSALKLKSRATPSHATRQDDDQRQQANELLDTLVREQRLSLAALNAAIAAHARSRETLPFESFIRLGTRIDERHATLAGLKLQKIQDARRYLAARTQCFDLDAPSEELSRFLSPSGHFCLLRVDVTPFDESMKSVRQVYDALLQYFYTLEISVSEALGGVMVRESDDSESHDHDKHRRGVSQNRFLTTGTTGVPVELNAALFSAFLKAGDGSDVGVIVGDSIDHDELFPYNPAQRVRQDVVAALTVRSVPKAAATTTLATGYGQGNAATAVGDDRDSTERTIVLTRVVLLRLHKTELPIAPLVMEQLRDDMNKCGAIMLEKTRAFASMTQPSSLAQVQAIVS